MSKIGIMGGTFNPIHNAHIEIAKAAYKQYDLDEVWFMPNHIPAYKNAEDVVNGSIRLQMVQLAIQEYPCFKGTDYEIKRTGKTYTFETLTMLSKDFPEHSFYFIMGADSLFYFEKWMHPEIITKYARILVAIRDDKGFTAICDKMHSLNKLYGGERFFPIKTPVYPVSSSEIRRAFSKKEYEKVPMEQFLDQYHLSPDIYDYIIRNNLYSNI